MYMYICWFVFKSVKFVMYMKNVMVGPDKPVIPGQRLF